MSASNHASRKLRPLTKTHGGKNYLCRRIVALMPKHETYVEPFIGGGSVLLNKLPSTYEIASDKNQHLINLWQCLNSTLDSMKPFRDILDALPYDEETFVNAKRKLSGDDLVVSALAYLCICRMSRGGMGRSFAWSDRQRGKRSATGPVPGEINSWNTFRLDDLPRIIERVEHVQFRCCDWQETLSQYGDSSDTLAYIDPPYPQDVRTAKQAYGEHEMGLHEHMELLRFLKTCKAKWFLSGYHNALYAKLLKDFPRQEWPMPNHSGQGKTKQRRVEVVWTNCENVDFKQVNE